MPTKATPNGKNRENASRSRKQYQEKQQNTAQPSKNLPQWIKNYLHWHQQARSRYPGMKLFTDDAAPNVLIRSCLGLCGGLNDRLGQLPWDLYLANQTGRVLLLHWHRPVYLEHFLVPNELDWTVPRELPGFFPSQKPKRYRVVSERDMKHIASTYHDLFEGYESNHPGPRFWMEHLDLSLHRAKTGKFSQEKILRHRLLGHINEEELEKRLLAVGETDMLHWTPSFGKIFWMFFRTSKGVQAELDSVYRQLDISPGKYSAVHCRVRHPKAWPSQIYVKGKNEDSPADRSGLPWYGEARSFAIATATRALQCAKQLQKNQNDERPNGAEEPIYFFSDSNDLVRYMAHELPNPNYTAAHASSFANNEVDARALQVVLSSSSRIVARDTKTENFHIDRQKGRAALAYYGTFVDLLVAVHARCVTYGVGYYAVLATKISAVSCKLLHQEEEWGRLSDRKRFQTNKCILEGH